MALMQLCQYISVQESMYFDLVQLQNLVGISTKLASQRTPFTNTIEMLLYFLGPLVWCSNIWSFYNLSSIFVDSIVGAES